MFLPPSVPKPLFATIAPEVPQAAPAPAGPRFVTHLKLSPERMEWLTDRVARRLDELRIENGLEPDGSCTPGGHMAIRERHQLTYDNELDFRKTDRRYGTGSIFQESNLTLGTNKRHVREMYAKAVDDLLGTRPFFAAIKRTFDSQDVAKEVEEFVQVKVDQSNVQQTLSESIRSALIRNETVIKTRYTTNECRFLGPSSVLVDATGNPVYTPSGKLVYVDDDVLPDPSVQGLFRLRKDPLFTMETGQYFPRDFPALWQVDYGYEGVEADALDFRSFLAPLRCGCIHKADMIAQLYDPTEQELNETYGGFEVFDSYTARRRAQIESSGELQPRQSQGEQEGMVVSAVIARIPMAECYLKCDADEDGWEEQLFVVFDRQRNQIAFADYLQNHLPKRPFEVIVGVETVPNRWYGVGVMHMMEPSGLYIDTQFNRYNIKDSKEASATFRNPQAVKEWKSGTKTVLGGPEIFDLEPGFDRDKNPPLFRINLQEVSEIGMELMQKMEQAGNLQFGVISGKDASASNLNQSRTATGILNLERTANVLMKATENDMAVGITKVLWQVVDCVLENMSPLELMFTRNGEKLLRLNKAEVRMLSREVRLILTRSRSSELLATNQQALAVAKDYRMLMLQDPEGAAMLRDFYVEQLKALEVPDSDRKLPEITPEMITSWQKQQQLNAQSAHAGLLRELLNYKDTPPSIQRQMEEQAGFRPAPPAEIKAEETKEAEADAKKGPPQ